MAILLNELAYLKYEAAQSSSAESIQLKLGLLFSLLEKIIRLVSNASQNQGKLLITFKFFEGLLLYVSEF